MTKTMDLYATQEWDVGKKQGGALEGGLLVFCRQLGPAHVLHFIYGLHAEAL